MRYILWLEWSNFYTGDSPDVSLVVRNCPDTKTQFVLDATRSARELGIQPGLPLRQARILCREAKVCEWKHDDYVTTQREWLDICTEFTGVIEPIDQHIAALDLTAHPHRLEIAERLIRKLVGAVRLPLQYGAATSKWIARLAAQHNDLGLAAQNPEAFLHDLPVECLLPVEQVHRNRLDFLGYHRIGEALRIPSQVLHDQFGESALTIAQAVRGGCYEAVQPIYPLDSLHDCFLFESPVEELSSVQEAFSALSRRIGTRLNGRQSSNIQLEIEYEDASTTVVSRATTQPIYNHITLRAVLGIIFPSDSEERAISAIRVSLKDLAVVSNRQHHLIQSDARPAANAALHSIQNSFGEKAVQLGSEIELPRREKVLREWRRSVGWH